MDELVSLLIRYDEGTLEEDEFIGLFQYLIDTGMAWVLQGSIGRTATNLIESGLCNEPEMKPLEAEVIYEPDLEDNRGPSSYYDEES